MSLNITSHPGRPGPAELVPSRYALKVGEIDVLVISDGVFTLPATTLAVNVDPAVLAVWMGERLQPLDKYIYPLNVLVVRSGEQTVLIDSGVGVEFPDSQAGRLVARLDDAGIDPASLTDVVITHLHVDHVGGLLSDGLNARLRPNIRIHVSAAEMEFWASPDFSRNTFGGFPDVLQSSEKRFVDMHRGHLRPFAAAEYEVAPGVVVCCNGGHTRGHSVVRIVSGGDRLTFVGDSVFQDHFDHPEWHNAFDHDPEEAVRVRVRLLRELAANGEPLVASHLPFPSVGRVAVAGDVFRWVPATWEY